LKVASNKLVSNLREALQQGTDKGESFEKRQRNLRKNKSGEKRRRNSKKKTPLILASTSHRKIWRQRFHKVDKIVKNETESEGKIKWR